MFKQMKLFALAGALAASASAATGAQAAGWIVGLVDGKSIVTIDPATRKVASKADIKGADQLVGIDVRPADGMLYGIAVDGSIVTIDPKSGQATVKSKLSEKFKPDVVTIVDFNPVVDRIRVMTLGRHQPSRQCRRRQVDQRRLAQVQGRRRQRRQEAEGRGRRLYQFVEGHQGDDALQHRRRDRRAGDAGAAERRRAQHGRPARHQGRRPGRLQHRLAAAKTRTTAGW